ncbi:LysM peptidoglycan-binding domain-containing protein [Vulcanococcus limneticus]|uniref:LysM peptidoglycan-binding domain-containing protein n=1 Tax=Vulcanococcus limneticus TaxID=2170428 RepID=UPI00398BED1E
MGFTLRPLGTALALALLLPLPSLAGEVVVKPGETLSEIADRYGVSVQRLLQLNGLKDPKDLWAGSRIQVPGAPGGSPGSSRSAASGGRGAGNYTVKPGETLSEIAERYNVPVERLLQLNGLKDGKDLWAGSRITVPGAGARAAAATSAKPTVNRSAKEHKVQPGETLSGIADLYGIPQERLVALNGLSKPDQLVSGTTLKLRGATSTAAAPAKPVTKPAAKPSSTALRPAAAPAAAVTAAPAAKPVAPKPTVATATASAKPAISQPVSQPAVLATKTPPTGGAKPNSGAAPSKPDWRTYGPLQVDWANWQSMGGSFVTPSLNSEGQPLYLAVNCTARRINATGQSGAWRSWDAPQSEFETQLLNDLCRSRGS